MNRRITEQNEESLSLNQNTVIQQYNNLDYSDEYQSSHSSEDHSLSRYNQEEMHKIDEISKIHKKECEDSYQNYQNQRKSNERVHSRPRNDLESKYDFGISPSTKEEYSLLNPPPRLSNQLKDFSMHSNQNHKHFDMRHLDEKSSQRENDSHQQISLPLRKKERQGQSKMQLASKKNQQFDIDNFLNAHPVPLKNKKGIHILSQSNQEKVKEKYKMQEYNVIKEQESIVLMTLPQNQSLYNERGHNKSHLVKAIRKNEEQLSKVSGNYERRFQDTRLNFINTFLPETMKIKSNPYNLLKYIHNKQFV